ncbi:MAG: HAMP domain-containing protein [Deltaproteobacteria bacterium]|nr:HAMP domain-containing protein [Deltaproteobacteria bacterium]
MRIIVSHSNSAWQYLEEQDRRRRRQERWILVLVLLVWSALTYTEFYYFGRTATAPPIPNELFIFGLINLNILLLVFLLFLIFRNLVKLLFEPKSSVRWGGLSRKLGIAFLSVTLLPTLLLFGIASRYVTQSIDSWFSEKIETSQENALQVVRSYYADRSQSALLLIREVGREMGESQASGPIQDLQNRFNLEGLAVLSSEGKVLEKKVLGDAWMRNPPEKEFLSRARENRGEVRVIRFGEQDVIEAVAPVKILEAETGWVWSWSLIPASLSKEMEQISTAFEDYQRLEMHKNPIKQGYIFTLLLVTLAVLFASIWFGIYVARGMTRPLQQLAEGTRKIAAGDWDVSLESASNDEMGTLVKSFNRMVGELKEKRDELMQTQKIAAWQEVARHVAHEIKNPLTPIQLSAQRLRRRYLGQFREDAIFDNCTETIIQQVDELKRLVDQFAQFARLPKPILMEADLNEIIREIVPIYQEGHKEIQFDLQLSADLPLLQLDREQIHRVLINLLENAVAAMEGAGKIALGTSFSLDSVRLEVRDTGAGIDPIHRDRIFEPYFSTKVSGTGLGLAIVHRIVQDHKAKIRVEASLPQGTVFILEFPRVISQSEEMQPRTLYKVGGLR